MEAVNERAGVRYPNGVTFNKSLPYLVDRNSEVGELIEILLSSANLPNLDGVTGEFSCKVRSLIKKGYNPHKAFVVAFFDGCGLPTGFTSMENTAWSFADNAWYFDKWVYGSRGLGGVGRREYDMAMKSLSEAWGKFDSHWEDVVRAFWKFKS